MSLQPCGCWIDEDGIPRCRCAADQAVDEEDAWIRIAAQNATDARDREKNLVEERDEARREISLICGMLADMQAAWKGQFNVLHGKAVDFDRGYATGLIQAVTEVGGLLKSVKQANR